MAFIATFAPLPTQMIMSLSLNLLLSMRLCIEVHIWTLKVESNTQLAVEETIRLDSIKSIPSEGLSSFFIFRLSR